MWTHRLSLFVAAVTFCLLVCGQLAAWPGLVPGGLVAPSLVVLSIGIYLLALIEGRRTHPAVPSLAALALLLAAAAGWLGAQPGSRELALLFAWGRLSLRLLFLGALVGVASLTRPAAAALATPGRDQVPGRSYRLLVVVTALCFGELVLGMLIHGLDARPPCGGLPLCDGEGLPLGGLRALHRLHGLLFAVLTFVTLPPLRDRLRRRSDAGRRALITGVSLAVLLQLGLGLFNVWSHVGPLPVAAHLGLGALIFSGLLVLCFRLRAARQVTGTASLGLVSPQGDAA